MTYAGLARWRWPIVAEVPAAALAWGLMRSVS